MSTQAQIGYDAPAKKNAAGSALLHTIGLFAKCPKAV
jgi:hypothetical protein